MIIRYNIAPSVKIFFMNVLPTQPMTVLFIILYNFLKFIYLFCYSTCILILRVPINQFYVSTLFKRQFRMTFDLRISKNLLAASDTFGMLNHLS